MGRLLVMRHCRTAENAERRLMGRDDPPLDDVGLGQASAAALALRGVRLDAVYASPLARARQTADAVAQDRGLTVRISHDLIEMDFGDAVRAGRRPKLEVKTTHRYDPLPGGESLNQVWGRAQRFVGVLAPMLVGGQSVLAVCHYRIAQLLAGVLSGCDFDRAVEDVRVVHLRNGSIHEFYCEARGAGVLATAPPVLRWRPPDL